MLSERMTTSNVYSISKHIPATDDVISPVPDGNGLVDGTWTQPVGNAFGGGAADSAPTSFPRIWNNAGYLTPTSGIVNTDNLNGDGAALQIAKMPDNGEPFETEVSQAVRDAGAVGGFMKYNSGVNAGWRSGYMSGGSRVTGGGSFNAYDGQTFGGKYGITHLGVHVDPTSHPHLFRPVNYWHPFSIFNPDIDAYWPGGDQTPKYGGTVAEINGIRYAMFTAYKWIGDGGNTYISQHARPASSILIQRRGIGDINYHGPITPGGMFGLSDQGYNYLSGRAKRRTLRGGPIYRKAGSGRGITIGRGGTKTTRGAALIPIDRGAGKVAQRVAKELPPKPTPAEIRKATVDEFRKSGDNYSANKFYTEDRISELESKQNLTYSEQKELDQLKVNAVHMNQNPPEPTPPAPPTPAENNSITNPHNFPPPPGIEIDTDSNSEAVENSQESKTEFQKMNAQQKKAFLDEQLPSTAQVESMDAASIFEFVNSLVSAGGNLLEFITYNAGLGPEYTSDNPKPVQLPEKDTQQVSNIANRYLRENVDPKDWGNLSQEHMSNLNALLNGGNSGVPGWEKIQKDFFGEVIGVPTQATQGVGQDEFRNIFNNLGDPTLFADFIETDANGNSYVTGMKDNYTFTGWDDAKASKTNKLNPYNLAANLIGFSNNSPLDSRRVNSPYTYENMDGSVSKTGNMPIKMNFLPPDGIELSDEAKNNLINNYNDNQGPLGKFSDLVEKFGELAMMEPQDMAKAGINAIKDLFGKLKNGILDGAKNEQEKNIAKSNADKYPPPKQESIFTNEDGSKIKYYTRSIFTGKDGKTYKSVLSLPFIESKDGGEGRFATLYHPGAYEFNVPLFDTPMDEALGDYTPPDDLPDIPFTPPEEPDNRKDYEKNRDKQRKFRFNNSYKSKGDVLSEEAKLGHFEPEELYVDIEKLRKGIMPEFPKKSPKIIDGYHQDSKIKPKEPSKDVYLKLDPKDLIRNHRLKQKEADEMMKTIDMINAHIEEHPEDLIHAQQRYPVDDPRLAELNWKMDQMLQAGEDYLDKNFKENQTLYKRATDRTKKNIKLTDPEYVQQKYDELRGTIKPESKPTINRKSPSRFFKKPKKKSSMEEIDDKIKQLDKDLLL